MGFVYLYWRHIPHLREEEIIVRKNRPAQLQNLFEIKWEYIIYKYTTIISLNLRFYIILFATFNEIILVHNTMILNYSNILNTIFTFLNKTIRSKAAQCLFCWDAILGRTFLGLGVLHLRLGFTGHWPRIFRYKKWEKKHNGATKDFWAASNNICQCVAFWYICYETWKSEL